MAKEKLNCGEGDELYGGEASALEHAFKTLENNRKLLKKVMKPAEDAAKELENDTATEKVRLQGTKETKGPSLKPYTEGIDVKDRKELAEKISEIKTRNNNWKIGRSLKEGFRYTVTEVETSKITEAKEEESDLEEVPEESEMMKVLDAEKEEVKVEDELDKNSTAALDVFKAHLDIHGKDNVITISTKPEKEDEKPQVISFEVTEEEFAEVAAELGDGEAKDAEVEGEETANAEVTPEEDNAPLEEIPAEGMAEIDANTKEEKEEVKEELLNESVYHYLDKVFATEEEAEAYGRENCKEDDWEIEQCEDGWKIIIFDPKPKSPRFDENDISSGDVVDTNAYGRLWVIDTHDDKFFAADNEEDYEMGIGHYYFYGCITDIVNESLKEDKSSEFGIHIEHGHSLEEYMEKFGEEYNEGLLWDFSKEDFENGAVEPNEDIVYWAIEVDGEERFFETDGSVMEIDESVSEKEQSTEFDEELQEASTAEKRAFKNGGQDYADLIAGRAIAQVKDEAERDMLIAQKRMETRGKQMSDRPTVSQTLARKERAAEDRFGKKQMSMAKAGVDEELDYQTQNNLEQEIWNMLTDEGVGVDDVYFMDDDLYVTIRGDWKHDHIYGKNLIEKFFAEKGLSLRYADERLLDDGESDYYTAQHIYKVSENLDGEVKVSEEETLEEAAKIDLDSLEYFQPWGGAKDVYKIIVDHDKLQDLDKALEEMYPNGITASALNDLLWFEKDWVFEKLDINPDVKTGNDVVDVQ